MSLIQAARPIHKINMIKKRKKEQNRERQKNGRNFRVSAENKKHRKNYRLTTTQ